MNQVCQTLAQQAKEAADKNRELVETPSTRVQWLNTFAEELIELTVLKTLEHQKIFRDVGMVDSINLEVNTKQYFGLST